MPTDTAKPKRATGKPDVKAVREELGRASRGLGSKTAPDDGLTQSERFIKAARELECDDDPERFAERVRKLAKAPRK